MKEKLLEIKRILSEIGITMYSGYEAQYAQAVAEIYKAEVIREALEKNMLKNNIL